MATQVVELTGDEARLFRSLDKIIQKEKAHENQLGKTAAAGGKVADAGGRIAKGFGDASTKGKALFSDDILRKAIGLGSAMGVIATAAEAYKTFLAGQEELLDRALQKQLGLARVQQEAAKNLAGLTLIQRNELLQNTAADIARGGLVPFEEVTTAIGAVASTGVSDPNRIANAVRQASRIEGLTPDQTATTAAAGAAVRRQAGLSDVREAISLVQTTGTQARIVDPQKLVENLPGAVGAAVATVPNQDPQEAARQSAALFAQITQAANDEQGKSSRTFQEDLVSRLSAFFQGLEDERIDARSRIQTLERKQNPTEANIRDIGRLREFLAASEGLQDPATIQGRIDAIRASSALSQQFVGEGFGEKRFQTFLGQLFSSDSTRSDAIRASTNIIRADVPFFEREVSQLTGSTPQLRIANAVTGAQNAIAAREATDIARSQLQAVRDIVADTIEDTTPAGPRGFIGGLDSEVIRNPSQSFSFGNLGGLLSGYGLRGSDALSEGFSGIRRLAGQRSAIFADNVVTSSEQESLNTIDSSIDRLRELLLTNVGESFFSQAQVNEALEQGRRQALGLERQTAGQASAGAGEEFLRKQDETIALLRSLVEEMAAAREASQRTADNTQPRQPNYSSVQRNGR